MLKRLRGLKTLVFDAVEETTNLVQQTHESVTNKTIRYARVVEPLSQPVELVGRAQQLTASGVYATIRIINRGIDKVTDVTYEVATEQIELRGPVEPTTPLRADAAGSFPWLVDAAEGALNGFIGDYLERKGNQLQLEMALRVDGRVVEPTREELAAAYPEPTGKICVFVHGLSCTEWSWSLMAEASWGDPEVTYGTLLSDDLGITPLYLRYNTGRHISDNGRDLSDLIQQIENEWPVPIEEITLIGHSMGGLVSRSAVQYGDRYDRPWVAKLRHVFSIGSPHMGAPLEKGTNALSALLMAFDTPGTRVPAAILNARSAGIKDLRFGYTTHEEWDGKDPDAFLENHRREIPFVDHAGYYFFAGSLHPDPRHPVTQYLGDLLVRLPSAAGRDPEPARCIPFHFGRVFPRMHHFTLVNHPDVYDQIKALIEGRVDEVGLLGEASVESTTD